MALWQLLALGFGLGAVRWRVAQGRLRRVHQGVYAVGHRALRAEGRWMAAVLACGEGATLSHISAAALWGIRPTSAANVHVTAPRGRDGHSGISLHRARALSPDDITEKEGIPTTTVARTLLDLAATLSLADLERTVAQAEIMRLLDLDEVHPAIARANGHRGAGRLRAAVAAEPENLRSDLERDFRKLCRGAHLPRPRLNEWLTLGGGEEMQVDALWPEQRVAVELDGFEVHRTRHAFEKDREKSAILTAAGYRTLRFTWRQLQERPEFVTRTLRRTLAGGGGPDFD